MKYHTKHGKTLMFTLIAVFSILMSQPVLAATCKGNPMPNCSSVTNASSCANTYVSAATATAATQCMWNNTFCSNSGVQCSVPH